jgi:hypothetical protein
VRLYTEELKEENDIRNSKINLLYQRLAKESIVIDKIVEVFFVANFWNVITCIASHFLHSEFYSAHIVERLG